MCPTQDQTDLDRWDQLKLDPDYDTALQRDPESARCPSCSSIEHNGDRCSWCHNDLEVF